jgi:hypothetical protein
MSVDNSQSILNDVLAQQRQERAPELSDEDYSQVFSESYPIALYVAAGALIRQVDRVLRSRTELTTRDRANIRFYVLTWFASTLTRKSNPKAPDVANLDLKTFTDEDVEAAIDAVLIPYNELGGSDQAAKGPILKQRLQLQIDAAISGPNH